jgi:hypothetical protein
MHIIEAPDPNRPNSPDRDLIFVGSDVELQEVYDRLRPAFIGMLADLQPGAIIRDRSELEQPEWLEQPSKVDHISVTAIVDAIDDLGRHNKIDSIHRKLFHAAVSGESEDSYKGMLARQVTNGRLSEAEFVDKLGLMKYWYKCEDVDAHLWSADGLDLSYDYETGETAPAIEDLYALVLEETETAAIEAYEATAAEAYKETITCGGYQAEIVCTDPRFHEYTIQSNRIHRSFGICDENGNYIPKVTVLDEGHPAVGPPIKNLEPLT